MNMTEKHFIMKRVEERHEQEERSLETVAVLCGPAGALHNFKARFSFQNIRRRFVFIKSRRREQNQTEALKCRPEKKGRKGIKSFYIPRPF